MFPFLLFCFFRVIWVSWVSCWCRGHSACGPNTKKVMPRLRIWRDSSPCRDTSSSMRRPCSSARRGRRTGRAMKKLPPTASSSLWVLAFTLIYSFKFSWFDQVGDIYISLLPLLEQMSAVGITENAKGDNKKFEIWCNSREEVYIVQVS